MEESIPKPKMTEAEAMEMIEKGSKDFIEIVKKIESGPKLTQNHYGQYMTVLSALATDKNTASYYAGCLVLAGANRQGVVSALKLLF